MSTITVRDAKIEDAARILEIYAYYVEYTVISFEWDVPSLEEFENRMRDIMKKYPYLVIEQDGVKYLFFHVLPSMGYPTPRTVSIRSP